MLRTLLSTGSRLAAQDVRVAFQGMNAIHASSSAGMGMGSHASDNDPDVLHREKHKNLSGTHPLKRQCIELLGCQPAAGTNVTTLLGVRNTPQRLQTVC